MYKGGKRSGYTTQYRILRPPILQADIWILIQVKILHYIGILLWGRLYLTYSALFHLKPIEAKKYFC
jgi:hypothetical protein